jgi:acyl carrier protein phosphodiesterase
MPSIEQRLGEVEERVRLGERVMTEVNNTVLKAIGDLGTSYAAGLAELRNDIREMRAETVRRLELVDRRFEQIDQRFERIDARFVQIDGRFVQMDDRFVQIDARLVQMDDRFVQIDGRLVQMDARFVQVDARFLQIDGRFVWLVGLQFAVLLAVVSALLSAYYR